MNKGHVVQRKFHVHVYDGEILFMSKQLHHPREGDGEKDTYLVYNSSKV